jgi:hypothetical protein
VYDRTYYGKPAWARERIAIARVGDVELELMEVIDGPSIYQDWIEERGEGLHHINFLVGDFDAAIGALTHEGFECIQSGKFGNPEKGCAYAYFDIPPLRTIWEPVYGNEPGVKPRNRNLFLRRSLIRSSRLSATGADGEKTMKGVRSTTSHRNMYKMPLHLYDRVALFRLPYRSTRWPGRTIPILQFIM